jgi:hypothetical protein
MNYRDLQNISNLSQQILVEGANEEHNVLNRWPYTSPYLQESTELDEASVTDDRVRRNQKAFGSNYTPPRDWDQSANRGKGAVLNTKQKEKQRRKGLAKGAMGEAVDLYDIILSHLLDEGYAETPEQAEVIMVNMSEEWRESIFEATVLAAKGGVAGAVQVKQTKTPGFLGTGIGSKTVSTPIPGTFTRNTPGRIQNGPREFDAYGSGSKGAEAEMSDRSGPTDAERSRYNSLVTSNNTVGDDVEPSPRAVNRRAYEKGHSGLMPERRPSGQGGRSTSYIKPNDSWRGY